MTDETADGTNVCCTFIDIVLHLTEQPFRCTTNTSTSDSLNGFILQRIILRQIVENAILSFDRQVLVNYKLDVARCASFWTRLLGRLTKQRTLI